MVSSELYEEDEEEDRYCRLSDYCWMGSAVSWTIFISLVCTASLSLLLDRLKVDERTGEPKV